MAAWVQPEGGAPLSCARQGGRGSPLGFLRGGSGTPTHGEERVPPPICNAAEKKICSIIQSPLLSMCDYELCTEHNKAHVSDIAMNATAPKRDTPTADQGTDPPYLIAGPAFLK
jgi:hypothetical protein